MMLPKPASLGGTRLRGTAGGRLLVKVSTQAAQTGRIGEARHGEPETLRAARGLNGDLTVLGDINGRCAGRNGLEAADQRQAIHVHHLALRIEFKGAIARVADRAISALHLEETVTLNRDVEFFTRLRQLTLSKNLRSGGDTRAVADLDAGGDEIAAARVGAGGAGLLVEQILKLDLAPLETGRVHVRQIIGDGIQVELLGLHAGGSGI